jgi:hypothetical protein
MIPQPEGRFDEKTGQWELTRPWACPLSVGNSLSLDPGFTSDGASIPRVLWPLVGPRFGAKTFPAALAHDALYAAELLSRRQCDMEFARLLGLYGVGWFRRRLYYRAVRGFGWIVWQRHSVSSVAQARSLARLVVPTSLGH